MVAGVDVLRRLQDLDAAVRLHLAQIHRQRGVALLFHPDGAARPIELDLGQALVTPSAAVPPARSTAALYK